MGVHPITQTGNKGNGSCESVITLCVSSLGLGRALIKPYGEARYIAHKWYCLADVAGFQLAHRVFGSRSLKVLQSPFQDCLWYGQSKSLWKLCDSFSFVPLWRITVPGCTFFQKENHRKIAFKTDVCIGSLPSKAKRTRTVNPMKSFPCMNSTCTLSPTLQSSVGTSQAVQGARTWHERQSSWWIALCCQIWSGLRMSLEASIFTCTISLWSLSLRRLSLHLHKRPTRTQHWLAYHHMLLHANMKSEVLRTSPQCSLMACFQSLFLDGTSWLIAETFAQMHLEGSALSWNKTFGAQKRSSPNHPTKGPHCVKWFWIFPWTESKPTVHWNPNIESWSQSRGTFSWRELNITTSPPPSRCVEYGGAKCVLKISIRGQQSWKSACSFPKIATVTEAVFRHWRFSYCWMQPQVFQQCKVARNILKRDYFIVHTG